MSGFFDLSRRAILARLPAGLAVAMGIISGPVWARGTVAEIVAQRLVACLRQRDLAARLGRRYLAAMSHERALDRLVGKLAERCGESERVLAVCPNALLRARLARAIRLDFEEGRVAQVDGWLLAHSEARLLALAAVAV